MKITIIGAGPAGLYCAYKLAKEGLDVDVYEEHKVVGEPVQCAGIVTSDINHFFNSKELKRFTKNKLRYVKLYSKNNSTTLPSKDLVIDRKKFDQFIEKKAKKSKANIFKGYRYLGYSNKKVILADKNNKMIKRSTDILIGADGPLSDVAKSNRLFKKRSFYLGIQAVIKGKFKQDTYETYFGSISKDFFAWVIPESKTRARIGLAGRYNIAKRFNRFLDIKGIKPKDIIKKQGGLIPIYKNYNKYQSYNKNYNLNYNLNYNKNQIIKNNIFLIGDAALQVKATTGGGIIQGLTAANILSRSISAYKHKKRLYKKDFEDIQKSYIKGLKKLNTKLKVHLLIRKTLNNFSDKDYNDLITFIDDKGIKDILFNNNREDPFKIMTQIILKKPSFLVYIALNIPKLFK